MIEFHCPSCNKRMVTDQSRVGMTGLCSRCKKPVVIPGVEDDSDEIYFEEVTSPRPPTAAPRRDTHTERWDASITKRYPNANRYLAVMTWLVWAVHIAAVAVPLFMTILGIAKSLPGIKLRDLVDIPSLVVVTTVAHAFWWLIVFWSYICWMLLLEIIQAHLDIEHNTRATATWLSKITHNLASKPQ